MANELQAWTATLVDGSIVQSNEVASFDHLEYPCHMLTFRVNDIEYHVSCVHDQGEHIELKTSRAIKVGVNATTPGDPLNMPFAMIVSDRHEARTCIFIHPRHGVMMSTMTLRL